MSLTRDWPKIQHWWLFWVIFKFGWGHTFLNCWAVSRGAFHASYPSTSCHTYELPLAHKWAGVSPLLAKWTNPALGILLFSNILVVLHLSSSALLDLHYHLTEVFQFGALVIEELRRSSHPWVSFIIYLLMLTSCWLIPACRSKNTASSWTQEITSKVKKILTWLTAFLATYSKWNSTPIPNKNAKPLSYYIQYQSCMIYPSLKTLFGLPWYTVL